MSTTVTATLPLWPERLISELDAADRRAEAVARGLSPLQLNWHPSEGAWSIGQCLHHLRVGNEIMVPVLSAALQGHERQAVREIRLGWFSRKFIQNYIAPNPTIRARAPKKIQPGRTVEPTILEAFLRSNDASRALVRQAADYNVNRIRYNNPFIPFLRFTIGAGLEIIAKHEARHLAQAEAVCRASDFPAPTAPA